MIKLKQIIKENNELDRFKKLAIVGKRIAAEMLTKKGLQEADYFILKVKKASNPEWIAQYRTNSVLSGRPIFWINQDLEKICYEYDPNINVLTVLVDNIIHEWFHAITDMFRIVSYRRIDVGVSYSAKPDQKEENDAEDFMRWITNAEGTVSPEKAMYFKKCIDVFNNLWQNKI